jgi:hypothetical protein
MSRSAGGVEGGDRLYRCVVESLLGIELERGGGHRLDDRAGARRGDGDVALDRRLSGADRGGSCELSHSGTSSKSWNSGTVGSE